MMIKMRKKYLAIAIASGVSLGTFVAQAEDFNASATLQNTLAITNLQDLDIGTVFASATGAANTDGVGGITISPAGIVTAPATLGTPRLTSLSTPTPAQGSVAIAADFTLTLPPTATILVAEFDGSNTGNIGTTIPAEGVELTHSTNNPSVPSLWLMHFTIGDVSGGSSAEGAANNGVFTVTQDFGATDFVFNIGGTVTTEPGTGTALNYQEGVYSGIFPVTAAY